MYTFLQRVFIVVRVVFLNPVFLLCTADESSNDQSLLELPDTQGVTYSPSKSGWEEGVGGRMGYSSYVGLWVIRLRNGLYGYYNTVLYY